MSFKYKLIQPPYALNFRLLDKKQADEFSQWFVAQIPERITELSQYVKSTPGFEGWDANLAPDSLDDLGNWFFSHVQTRPRSAQEKKDMMNSISPALFKQIGIADYDISGLTVSICSDVGMYFCPMLMRDVKGLRWEVVTGPKNSVDFHMPVLRGNKLAFNPIQLLTSFAYGVASGVKRAKDLRDLYETWVYFLQQ